MTDVSDLYTEADKALEDYKQRTGDNTAYVKVDVSTGQYGIHSKSLAKQDAYVSGSKSSSPTTLYRSGKSDSGSVYTGSRASDSEYEESLAKRAAKEYEKANPNRVASEVYIVRDEGNKLTYKVIGRDKTEQDTQSGYEYKYSVTPSYSVAERESRRFAQQYAIQNPDAVNIIPISPVYDRKIRGYKYGLTYESKSAIEQQKLEQNRQDAAYAKYVKERDELKAKGFDINEIVKETDSGKQYSYTAKPGFAMLEKEKESYKQKIQSEHPSAKNIDVSGKWEGDEYKLSATWDYDVKSPYVVAASKKPSSGKYEADTYLTKGFYDKMAGASDVAAVTSVKLFGIKPDEEIYGNKKSSTIQKGFEHLATRSSQMITETPRMVGTLAVASEYAVKNPVPFLVSLPASALMIAKTPVTDPIGTVAMVGVGGALSGIGSKTISGMKTTAAKGVVKLSTTPEQYSVFKNVVSAQKELGSMKPRPLMGELQLSKVTSIGKEFGSKATKLIVEEPQSWLTRGEGGSHRIFGRTTEINQMRPEFIEPRGYTGDVDILVGKPEIFTQRVATGLGKSFKVDPKKPTNIKNVVTGEKAFDVHAFKPTDMASSDVAHPPTIYEVPRSHKLTNVNLLRQDALPSQIAHKGLSLQGEFGLYQPLKGKLSSGPITSDLMKSSPFVKGGIQQLENFGIRTKYRYGPKEHRIKDALDYMNEMSAEIYERKQLNVKYEPPVKLKTAFESVKSYYSKPEVYIKYLEGKKFGEAISKMEFGKPMSSPVKSTIKTGRLFTSSDFYGKSPSMISSLLASPSFASSFNIKSNIKSPISSKSSSSKSSSRNSSSSKSSSMLSPSRISSVSSILSSSKISSRSLISGSSKSSSSRSSYGSSKSSSSRSSSGTSSSSRSSSFSSSFGSSGSSFGSSGSSGSSFIGGSGSSSIRYPYGKPSVGSDYQRYKYKKGSSLYGFTEKIKTFTPSQALGIKSESIKFKKLKIRGVKLK